MKPEYKNLITVYRYALRYECSLQQWNDDGRIQLLLHFPDGYLQLIWLN